MKGPLRMPPICDIFDMQPPKPPNILMPTKIGIIRYVTHNPGFMSKALSCTHILVSFSASNVHLLN